MDQQDRWKRLTIDEARRALYIDFEGEKGRDPVLLGCANKPGKGDPPWVMQYVTASLFAPLTDDTMVVLSLPEAIERIVQRAESRGCRIVAWSEHELNVVRTSCPELLDRFAARFGNARGLAERWRNKCHGGDGPPTNRLPDHLELIGHVVPPGAEAGRAGVTIRRIRTSLEKGRGLAGVTEDQLHRWKQLRDHNRHDCAGMREVCLLAAREIAEHDRPPPKAKGNRAKKVR